MAFARLAEKLDQHLDRLRRGKAHKIKLEDIEKTISKLEKRKTALLAEAEVTPKKAERIAHKIAAADEMLDRARGLLSELRRAATAPEPASDRGD